MNKKILILSVLLSACSTNSIRQSAETPGYEKTLASLNPLRQIAQASQRFEGSSPDKNLRVNFWINDHGDPVYSVNFKDRTILDESRLGFNFADGQLKNLMVTRTGHREIDATYSLPVGKAKTARDHYQEFSYELREKSGTQRSIVVSFRVYDEGVGFRYVFSTTDIHIQEELSSFNLHDNPTLYAVQLPYNSTFEGYYKIGKLQSFASDKTMILPVLAGCDGQTSCLAITEAGLSDFSGLYLNREGKTTLAGSLDPIKASLWRKLKVNAKAPFASPWRVIMIGDSANALNESNIVNNLNDPTAIGDTSWVHPGKIEFPWWNGYALDTDPKDNDPDHKPGLTTWAMKKYIDFCAENHIEFFSFDGFDQAWYGGDIGNPPARVDVTKAIPSLNMNEILGYAKERGVRARIWMHKDALLRSGSIDEVFATYEKWGIEGVMIDFMNADDQATVDVYTNMIKLAAKHHLTINFHGSWKPTGLTRTYPNLLSHEAVKSSEYNRFINKSSGGVVSDNTNNVGAPPEHEVIYAWVRQLAGPTDIHTGSFNPVLPENFNPKKDALRAMGTLARQLALFVVVESGIPMVADAPREYLKRPAPFEFVKQVPAAWDETKFVGGTIGQSIAVARRNGSTWYLGAITDRKARVLQIPLAFLGNGTYKAEIYLDGNTNAHADDVVTKTKLVKAQDILDVSMAASGGYAVRFLQQ